MKLVPTLLLLTIVSLQASDLDTIGVALLRQVDPTLQGNGVKVAQPEGSTTGTDFEVNPAAVGQPTNLFTWISSAGTSTSFPNIVGVESSHANLVGGNFYGLTNGVAPQVSHVDNYEVGYFFINFIQPGAALPARVVNQSFAFNPVDQNLVDQTYDDYAANRNTIFVSIVGNGGQVLPPGTCYNSISSGNFSANSSIGPTADGRCKPDITAPDTAQAPNGANSYSTPYVAGSAAVLVQAASRGDGGSNTNAASDLRTIKALLLNGAIKPVGWTNGAVTPLDARYGAGVVNIFNSWMQLKGGLHGPIESTSVGNTSPHPPGGNASNEPVLVGWDNSTIANSGTQDRINHYYFNLTGTNSFTLTATLVWNRREGETILNDLNLFLYRMSNSNLVAASTSIVDNVEHLFLTQLPPGRYDLQVFKERTAQVSSTETYALAFEMFNLRLGVTRTNDNIAISWPVSPTGFRLQSTTDLNSPTSWTTIGAAVSVNTNTSQNIVTLPVGSINQYFRLVRPTADFGL